MANGGLPISAGAGGYVSNPLLTQQAYISGAQASRLTPSTATSVLQGVATGLEAREQMIAQEAKNKYYEASLEAQKANQEYKQAQLEANAEKFKANQKDRFVKNTLAAYRVANDAKNTQLRGQELLIKEKTAKAKVNKDLVEASSAQLFQNVEEALGDETRGDGRWGAMAKVASMGNPNNFIHLENVLKQKNGRVFIQNLRDTITTEKKKYTPKQWEENVPKNIRDGVNRWMKISDPRAWDKIYTNEQEKGKAIETIQNKLGIFNMNEAIELATKGRTEIRQRNEKSPIDGKPYDVPTLIIYDPNDLTNYIEKPMPDPDVGLGQAQKDANEVRNAVRLLFHSIPQSTKYLNSISGKKNIGAMKTQEQQQEAPTKTTPAKMNSVMGQLKAMGAL